MSNEIATIDFHGDEIIAYKDEETEKVQVNVRRICESLGVNFAGQSKKLSSDPTYSKGLVRRHISTEAGQRQSLFIDKELLQGWLFSIQTKRVKPELREKLGKYKLEAAKALHDHFTKGFSVNEQAFGQAPDIVIKGLVDKIDELSLKLDNRPTAPTEELVERRITAMGKIFDVLGKPDETIVSTLRDQMLVHENINAQFALDEHGNNNGRDVWPPHKEDVLEFSKKHPDRLFLWAGGGMVDTRKLGILSKISSCE